MNTICSYINVIITEYVGSWLSLAWLPCPDRLMGGLGCAIAASIFLPPSAAIHLLVRAQELGHSWPSSAYVKTLCVEIFMHVSLKTFIAFTRFSQALMASERSLMSILNEVGWHVKIR